MLGQKATRAVATTLVVGGLLAAGCRTDREITRPDPEPVTTELLTESLLTQDDVPSSYELDEGAEAPSAEIMPEHECDDDLAALEPQETASATFTGRGLDTTLSNTISYYPGDGGAVGAIYNDLIASCDQVVMDDEGLSFTASPLDFGVLSDDTLPVVFTLQYDDGTIEERNVIVIRAGDLVSTIRLDGPRPSDLVLLDTVTRTAIGNLGELDQIT